MRAAIGIAAALAVFACAAPAAAAADEPYPVPWTIDLSQQVREPDAPPAGSNDWSCEPSPSHPEPVVLVHGLAANRTVNFSTLSPFLANHGFCVFALTYGTRPELDPPAYQPGGLAGMQGSARALKRFAARVLRSTGASAVDIVGHSEGSLMPNWWVKYLGGDRVVDDYVGITPLWDGTNLAGLATIDGIGRALGLSAIAYSTLEPVCASCRQFLSGSDFIRRMNAGGGPAVAGVDYTMLLTRNDELVVPYTSGLMDGARNIVVQDSCALDQSEHLSIAFDPVAAHEILNALDPRHAGPVPCTLVLPFVGAVGYSE
ncbi:MAG: lipase [Solirubrobacterales bacterium]|nr:lipase [Solirubrobacterales bacterium]